MQIAIEGIDRSRAADFMIVTVTKLETEAIEQLLGPVCPDGTIEVTADGRPYKLGKIGGYNVVCCKCKNSGTISAESATLTIAMALQDWPDVKAVLMPGICFGLTDDEGQTPHLGDVVASEKVFAYENREAGEQMEIKADKTSIFTADSNLTQAFKEANSEWERQNRQDEPTKAYVSHYVSGNVRFLDEKPTEELKKKFKQARAGDMEGHGLAAACQKHKKPWLLMKGVGDFGTRDENQEEHHKDAAAASAIALANMLKLQGSDAMGAIAPEGSVNFFFHHIEDRINDIFFLQYQLTLEDYYIERSIDKRMMLLIRTGCCWVYGKSGVGKSAMITRALLKNGIEYVLCDLSKFSRMPIELIFKHIYQTICICVNGTPRQEVQTFDEIADAMFAVVRKHYEEKTLYVLIEEIPFSFGTEQFRWFFDKLCSLIISSSINLGQSRMEFVLSSIDSPKEYIEEWQAKLNTRMKFVSMEQWTMEECKMLTSKLSEITMLKWDENLFPMEEFIKAMDYSPAKIKKTLNDMVLMRQEVVSKEVLEILMLG